MRRVACSLATKPDFHGKPIFKVTLVSLHRLSHAVCLAATLMLLMPPADHTSAAPMHDPACVGNLPGLSGISAGPDHNLWFIARCLDSVGRITPGGQVALYPMPRPDTWAGTIVAGPHQTLWFTEPNVGRVGRITVSGKVADFPLPPDSGVATELGLGPDGNIWATEGQDQALDSIAFDGQMTRHPLPLSRLSLLSNIITGPDHSIWLADVFFDQVARYTVAGKFSAWRVPYALVNNDIGSISSGPQGTIWVTRLRYHLVQVFYLAQGKLLTKASYTLTGTPGGVTPGPRGTMWLAQNNPTQFTVLTLGNPLPAAVAYPPTTQIGGFALGPDSAMWYTERYGTHIDRITPSGAVTRFTVPSAVR